MGLVTTALAGGWPHWGPGARITACVGMAALCLAPQPSLRKEARDTNLPASPEFVAFAEGVRERTPVESLGVMPPEVGSHYFRVFAERGLWIDPKDLGILSRERATYDLAQKRLTRLRAFYAPEATPADRSQLLEQMAAEGVGFVVTRATTPWGSSLPWPVTWESGGWRLHLRRNP
ncbi:MAG TPA: hypothetical protein DCM86_14760 [Verrucomicrobiales bacterium]|nr:hypothetical protein [Verrucomicrobiales bacterium]